MSHKTLTDLSPGTGVYEGDLAYGRRDGNVYKRHNDYSADRGDGQAKNLPVMPLRLVRGRNPLLWKKDPKVKEAKKSVSESQHYKNYVIETYRVTKAALKCNVRLKVGKVNI